MPLNCRCTPPLCPRHPSPPSFQNFPAWKAKRARQRTAASSTLWPCPSESSAWATTSLRPLCTTRASARATAPKFCTTDTIPRTTPSSKRSSTTWASATCRCRPACLTNTCPWVCWWSTRWTWSTRSWTTWWPSHARAVSGGPLVLSKHPPEGGNCCGAASWPSPLKHFKRQRPKEKVFLFLFCELLKALCL